MILEVTYRSEAQILAIKKVLEPKRYTLAYSRACGFLQILISWFFVIHIYFPLLFPQWGFFVLTRIEGWTSVDIS